MNGMHFFLVATLAVAPLGTCVSATTPGNAPVAPFHLEYATSRNYTLLGHTTLDLSRNGDGTWTLRSETKGTEGLASLLGINVTETSRFHWQDGKPASVAYEYVQDGIKSRQRSIAFDAATAQIDVTDGSKHHEYALQPESIDRNLVSLALAAALAQGDRAFTLPVAGKRALKSQHYKVVAEERIKVPAGTWDSMKVERTDADKEITIWFAKSLGWLPVRVEQSGKSTITLELASHGVPK